MNLFKRHIMRPKAKALYGIEIKKQPTLAYIEATERMGNLVIELIDEAFPGKTPKEILDHLAGITTEEFKDLAARLLYVVPKKAVEALREIVGCDDIEKWNALTPYEMSEVVKEFWKMNDLTAFFTNARSMLRATQNETNAGLRD